MRKRITAILAIAICLTMAACGAHEHSWTEATCTAPRTCTECGETEGEALGHTWTEATCTQPKTCSVCGETEGEAAGHVLGDANYQEAAVCQVCGESVGEPLTPAFLKFGLDVPFMSVGTEYDYTTKCFENDSITTGRAVITDYQIIDADATHEAREGYEWRTATLEVIFYDENAQNGGYASAWIDTDYYVSDGINGKDTEDGELVSSTVNYRGMEYEINSRYDILQQEWTQNEEIDGVAREWVGHMQIQLSTLVPVGYDGVMFALFDTRLDLSEGTYWPALLNYDNCLFFRFD